jgi:hypothetical protein
MLLGQQAIKRRPHNGLAKFQQSTANRAKCPKTHFHGDNTASNPVGDAKIPKNLYQLQGLNHGSLGSNKPLDCGVTGFGEKALGC